MKHIDAINMAEGLLDSEFNEFNHNAEAFCEALNWDKNSKGFKKAIKKEGALSQTADDVLGLALIIMSLDKEGTIDIAEDNQVSDYTTNCVCTHINR